MSCFSLAWIKDLLILLVIIIAVVAIIQLLVPVIVSKAPDWLRGGIDLLVAAIKIVLWAAVIIFVIVILFDLISCLLGMGGSGGGLLPRGR